MFCFTFVSDHNSDYLMLYSVQLNNMYSYLNSSLKLILYVVSPVNSRIATNYHYTNSPSSFLLFYFINFYFFYPHFVSLKIVSEYDQEIPQSQTADNPVAPRGRAAQPSRDTRKTN